MQILQWLFKEAHEQGGESSTFSPPTKREAICDQIVKKKKGLILRKHHMVDQSTKRIEGSKLGCKNLKKFPFICEKDIPKACLCSTLNLKTLGSFNRRRHFVYSMKMKKREELSQGSYVGNKVFPITEASLTTSSTGDKMNNKKDKKKPVSRRKELIRRDAACKSEKREKLNGSKVLQLSRRGTLKAAPNNYDQVIRSEPAKSSFRWDVEECYITYSPNSAISTASQSKSRRSYQIPPSPISNRTQDNITCREGKWITTDSEFVVLEL